MLFPLPLNRCIVLAKLNKKNTGRPADRCAPPVAGTDQIVAPAEEKTVLSLVISASGRGIIIGCESMAGAMRAIPRAMMLIGMAAAWGGWEVRGVGFFTASIRVSRLPVWWNISLLQIPLELSHTPWVFS